MTTPTKRRTRGRKRAESKRADLTCALGQGVKAAAKAGRAREAAQLADALARHRAARSEAAAARRLRHERSPERRAEEQALKEQFNQEVDRLVEQRIRERLQAKGVDPRPFLRGWGSDLTNFERRKQAFQDGIQAAAAEGRASAAAQLAAALDRHRAEAARLRAAKRDRFHHYEGRKQELCEQFNLEVDALVEPRLHERLKARGVDPRGD